MAETVLTASRKITRSLVPVATGHQLVRLVSLANCALSPSFCPFGQLAGFPCVLLCASDSLSQQPKRHAFQTLKKLTSPVKLSHKLSSTRYSDADSTPTFSYP